VPPAARGQKTNMMNSAPLPRKHQGRQHDKGIRLPTGLPSASPTGARRPPASRILRKRAVMPLNSVSMTRNSPVGQRLIPAGFQMGLIMQSISETLFRHLIGKGFGKSNSLLAKTHQVTTKRKQSKGSVEGVSPLDYREQPVLREKEKGPAY